jgi:hypothetical protein
VIAYRFMKENRTKHAIREKAGLLGVSSNASYQWAKQKGVMGENPNKAQGGGRESI